MKKPPITVDEAIALWRKAQPIFEASIKNNTPRTAFVEAGPAGHVDVLTMELHRRADDEPLVDNEAADVYARRWAESEEQKNIVLRRLTQATAERDELQRRVSHVVREQAANPAYNINDAVRVLLGGKV